MDRMRRLAEAISMLMEEEFSGYIKINFSQGSLGRIEKAEELEDAATILAGEKKGKKKNGAADICGAGRLVTWTIANALTLAAFVGAGMAAEVDPSACRTSARYQFRYAAAHGSLGNQMRAMVQQAGKDDHDNQ